jgi:hypothetical protein
LGTFTLSLFGTVVRSRRLELPRGFPHKHLKLARLPFRHDRIGLGAYRP